VNVGRYAGRPDLLERRYEELNEPVIDEQLVVEYYSR